MSLVLAQLTGTHSLPGCLPATPLELDNAPAHGLTPHPRVFMDIYGYFPWEIYIYISEKAVCAKAGFYKGKFSTYWNWNVLVGRHKAEEGTEQSSDLNQSSN